MSTQTHNTYSKSFLYELHWQEGIPQRQIEQSYTNGQEIIRALNNSSVPTRYGTTERGWVFRMIQKRTLYRLYWEEGHSIKHIASIFNTNIGLVREQYDRYGIPRRKQGRAQITDTDTVPEGFLEPSNTLSQRRRVTKQLFGDPDINNVRQRLYELHWQEGLYGTQIAKQLNSSKYLIKRAFDIYNVPLRSNYSAPSWVFRMLPKRTLYQLYWDKGLSTREIANEHNVSKSIVRTCMIENKIPIRQGSSNQFHPDGVPKGFGYEYDDGQTRVGAGTDELPDDPDPSKYIESYEAFDPDRLYELHWEYGMSIAHMIEYLGAGHSTIRHHMDKHGIPQRDKTDDPNWEPHLGVPPMFEWEHGVPPSEYDDTTDLEKQHGSTSWTDFSQKVRSDVRGDE